MNKLIGRRLGHPSKHPPHLNHQALRQQHTWGGDGATPRTYYRDGMWFAAENEMEPRTISERRALTRLGYLREKGRTLVPTTVTMSLVKQGSRRITVTKKEGQTMK